MTCITCCTDVHAMRLYSVSQRNASELSEWQEMGGTRRRQTRAEETPFSFHVFLLQLVFYCIIICLLVLFVLRAKETPADVAHCRR